jgi:hypothetical protein
MYVKQHTLNEFYLDLSISVCSGCGAAAWLEVANLDYFLILMT